MAEFIQGGTEVGDYKDLAKKYLKANRGRSLITIIGVVITVIVLYGGLNIAYSYLLHARDEERKDRDYEFVLMAESRSQAEQIAADDMIEKAYIGRYEYTDWRGDSPDKVLYKNAIYATGNNPYRMEHNMNVIAEKYDINAELNDDLALLYFQDGTTDGSMLMVILWTILLIAYIFAIFAVGIIRNTVQMFMMEQIKDYGILRCIGATKGQLKRIVYLMGALLECIGILIGIILGGLITIVIGVFTGVSAGYHLVPVIPVLICYLGDLYFVMRDNCKVIVSMTPISAVRGQFRIKAGRIKDRGRGLMGRIFGMEGEYARKSVLRNRGRFVKTVASLSVSIAALIAVMSVAGTLDNAVDYLDSKYGPYQLSVYDLPSQFQDIDTVEAGLPDAEHMRRIADSRNVISARKVYETNAYVPDAEELYSRFTEDYLNKTMYGEVLSSTKKRYEKDLSSVTAQTSLSAIRFRGFNKDDLTDLNQYLTDGTVDLSDRGILVVAGGSAEHDNELWNGDITYETLNHLLMNDYKVGDTISIVDTALLFSETQKAVEDADNAVNGCDKADRGTEKRMHIANDVYNRLVAEGRCHTYTVEGILDMGDKVIGDEGLQVYTTLDNYFAETGYTENQISGMEYQIDSNKITNGEIVDIQSDIYTEDGIYEMNMYFDSMIMIKGFKSINRVILMIAALVFALGAVNIINATAGNLHMRRKEFVQLRVIGMSRKILLKTVMLEGIMAVALADVIGIVTGTAIYFGEYSFLKLVIPMRFTPSVLAIAAGILLSVILVFGSIYLPLRKLPKSMAEDLTLEE